MRYNESKGGVRLRNNFGLNRKMEKTIVTLIEDYQKGDTDQFLLIAERFQPAITKYAAMLYKEEREDMISELQLSLLEAVRKINYCLIEGQCILFLNKALKNRFYELYRKSRQRTDHEQPLDKDCYDSLFCHTYDMINGIGIGITVSGAEWKEDLEIYMKGYHTKQKKILRSVFLEEKCIREAALEHKVSRQYTNRIKKKLLLEIRNSYKR